MKTTDDAWRDIIDLLQMPGHPGLFVLGSFAQRVTIYSQQVRAINLIDALAGLGHLAPSSSVAVVGAGFAGLTAAAALTSIGLRPTLFDSETVPMHRQLNCGTRYIHPHLYDWPFRSIDETRAGLPLLDWTAGNARAVARSVTEAWDRHYRHRVTLHLGRAHTVARIMPHQRQWQVITECNAVADFDLVILALGFGEEPVERGFSVPYWADIPLATVAVQQQQWLVSGAGDGALTDVMRLCIQHTDHEAALHAVVRALDGLGAAWLANFRQSAQTRNAGIALFETIDVEATTHQLRLEGGAAKVILNATPEQVFGSDTVMPNASLLNRLVVWLLWKKKVLSFAGGKLSGRWVKGKPGRYTVTVRGRTAPISCQQILLRHGPESLILPKHTGSGLQIGCGRNVIVALQKKWKALYASGLGDPTLVVNWPDDMLTRPRIAPDFTSYPAMFLYSKAKYSANNELNGPLLALNGLFHDAHITVHLGAIAANNIATLAFEDAVAGARQLSQAVQALCRAPILIVDGGDLAPPLALLLGIRAAVRRGVTLVYRAGDINEDVWQTIPFNLRETRIVKVDDDSTRAGFQQPLTDALEEGLRRFNSHPRHYSDLPGFDALRAPNGTGQGHSARPGKREILVLCPFEQNYEKYCWEEIRRATEHHFPAQPDGSAKRVIDLPAPEMLARRLFEAIRLDDICIADLTNDRANVYFELGVRLAAHPGGAHAIHCCNGEATPTSPFAPLRALLGSQEYTTEYQKTPRAVTALASIAPSARSTRGELGARFVFDIAERNINVTQEAGGLNLLDQLWAAITAAGGGAKIGQLGALPVMYGENIDIKRNTIQFIADGLSAYVLLSRHTGAAATRDARLEKAKACLVMLLQEPALPEAMRNNIGALLSTGDTP